ARKWDSTGRTGSCYDNAVTESFFASLETELIVRTRFATRSDAEREAFSPTSRGSTNPWWRHSANGWLSPDEYERCYIQTLQQEPIALMKPPVDNPVCGLQGVD